MKSDVGKYRLLKDQLNEARKTIADIGQDENPTLVKSRLVPILNRITAFDTWFDAVGERAAERTAKEKLRDALKDEEKRKKLVEFARTL